MSFRFVENGNIDEAARKLIRSHVMKGKNVGKARPRLARKPKGDEEESPLSGEIWPADFEKPNLSGDYLAVGATTMISAPRPLGTTFSSFTFPCQLQPYMENLLYQCKDMALLRASMIADGSVWMMSNQVVYPTEFCLPVDAKKSSWFQYLLRDEACEQFRLDMAPC